MGKRLLALSMVLLLVTPLQACGGESSHRSIEAYCHTVAKHRDRYLSAMDTATSSGGLGGLLGGVAAIGDIETMWADLAKVAPDDIQTDTEAVRDAWKETEDAAKSGDYLGVLTSALTNANATQRVNTYIEEKCGAEYAPV